MFYIKPKGSYYMYLTDYNIEKMLPVWSNSREDAVNSNDYELSFLFKLSNFINEKHNSDCMVIND